MRGAADRSKRRELGVVAVDDRARRECDVQDERDERDEATALECDVRPPLASRHGFSHGANVRARSEALLASS